MATYKPDRAGFARYMKSPELADVVKDIAEGVAARARATAPRSDEEHAHYADSIHVYRDDEGGVLGDRVSYVVVAESPHSTLVEWGRRADRWSPGHEGHHTMRNAAQEVTE